MSRDVVAFGPKVIMGDRPLLRRDCDTWVPPGPWQDSQPCCPNGVSGFSRSPWGVSKINSIRSPEWHSTQRSGPSSVYCAFSLGAPAGNTACAHTHDTRATHPIASRTIAAVKRNALVQVQIVHYCDIDAASGVVTYRTTLLHDGARLIAARTTGIHQHS